jgi:thioesterase domain-containing protein
MLFAGAGQADLLRRIIRRALAGPRAAAAEAMRQKLLLLLWRRAIAPHALRRSGLPVIMFSAEKARRGVTDPSQGWRAHAADLEVVTLRGDHWTMLHADKLIANGPSVHATLARRLAPAAAPPPEPRAAPRRRSPARARRHHPA